MANQPTTVAIMYGFAEGPWHGRGLKKHLRAAGYVVTKKTRQADIIIAHSASCYLIPRLARAKLIVHVDYTHWPGRSLGNSLAEALRFDLKTYGTLRWLVRCTIHDIHMLRLVHGARMIPGWKNPARKLDQLIDSRHVFVRNQHDSYCHVDALLHATDSSRTYVSLPGGHVDIWDNPERYVHLLQSVYET